MMQDVGQYGGAEAASIKVLVKEGNLSNALSMFERTFEGNQKAIANDPDLINSLLGHLNDPNKIIDVKKWLDRINPLLEGNLVMEGVAKKAREIIERGDAYANPNAIKFGDLNDKVENLSFEGKSSAEQEAAIKDVLIAVVNVEKDGLQEAQSISQMLAKVRDKFAGIENRELKDRFEGAVKVVENTFDVRRKALGINIAAAEYNPDILRDVRAAQAAAEYAVPHGIGGMPTVEVGGMQRRDSEASTGTQFFEAREGFGENLPSAQPLPRPVQLDAAQGPLDSRADRLASGGAIGVGDDQGAGVRGIYPSELIDENYAQLPLAPRGQYGPGVGFGEYPSGAPSQTMRLDAAAAAVRAAATGQPQYAMGAVPTAVATTTTTAAQPTVAARATTTDAENVHGTAQAAIADAEKQKAQKKDGEVVKFFKSHEGARYTLGTFAVIAAFVAPPVAVMFAAAMLVNELSPVLKPVVGLAVSLVVGTFEVLDNAMKAIANLGIAIKNLFSAEKTPYYPMGMSNTKAVFNAFMSKGEEKILATPNQAPVPTQTPARTTDSPQPTVQQTATSPAPYVGGYQAVDGGSYRTNATTQPGYDTVAPEVSPVAAALPYSLDVPAEQRYASAASIQRTDTRAAAVDIASDALNAAAQRAGTQPIVEAPNNSERYQGRDSRSDAQIRY